MHSYSFSMENSNLLALFINNHARILYNYSTEAQGLHLKKTVRQTKAHLFFKSYYT